MNAAEQYAVINATTAGQIKSHQLLVERAILHLSQYKEGDVDRQIKVQNILSQLQLSLNIKYQTSRDLHRVFAILWDSVETGQLDAILSAKDILEIHLETLKKVQSIN